MLVGATAAASDCERGGSHWVCLVSTRTAHFPTSRAATALAASSVTNVLLCCPRFHPLHLLYLSFILFFHSQHMASEARHRKLHTPRSSHSPETE